jgi:hypothetical protein
VVALVAVAVVVAAVAVAAVPVAVTYNPDGQPVRV